MKKLYIKQKVFKITDHYPILDENEEVIYYVDEDFTWVGLKVHVSDKNHNELFVIEKELFHLLPEFNINFKNGETIKLKSRFTIFTRAIDVLYSKMNIEIEGDFFSHNFVIKADNNELGRMVRKLLSFGDCFEIEVYDEEHMDLIVAMMIAMDYLIDQSQKS